MDTMVSIALSMAPEVARLVNDDPSGESVAVLAGTVQAVLGTSDPTVAAAILQRNPGIATQLHLELSQLAANWQKTSDHAALVKPPLAETTEVPQQAASLTDYGTLFAWAAPAISGVVVTSFGVVIVIVLTNGVSAGNETAANMLLGTLAAMATSVVSYWVGSSAGSARKDERLIQIAR